MIGNWDASATVDRVVMSVAVAAMIEIVLLNEDILLGPFRVWFVPAFNPDVVLFVAFVFAHPVVKCPEMGPEIV